MWDVFCLKERLSMIFRRMPGLLLAALLLTTAVPVFAQVAPAGQEGGLPISVGAGFSVYNLDWGLNPSGYPRYMEGVNVWADYHFTNLPLPHVLQGFGIQIEGSDISWGLPASLSNQVLHDTGENQRHDTAEGGPTYTWRKYRNFHPYGKFLYGFGSIDFPNLAPDSPATYRHDTRTMYSGGAGLDYRVGRNIWIRADYEYQFWPDLFGRPHALNPNGISVGAVYDFRHLRGNSKQK
jgi:opacity protein-like surface antigen